MRNRYKTVGGKGRTRVQIQGDVCRLCCSRKDCCRVASSSACFGFRYRSVIHHTAANSAARIRTMETSAVISDLTPIVLAECDLDETNSYLRKHERWNNIGDIVGDEKIWSTTVKTWKTDINNFINHNVDGKITEVDLPERHPQAIKKHLNQAPVQHGILALADVSAMVVKILDHCKLDIFGEVANGAITKCINQVTSKYRVGIYVDGCLAFPSLTNMPSLSICLSLLRRN